MSAEALDVAKHACIRLLLSRGQLSFGDDGSPVFEPPHATLVWAIQQASALVTWQTDVRDEGTAVGGTFALPHGLALHDEISGEPGFHESRARPMSGQREGRRVSADHRRNPAEGPVPEHGQLVSARTGAPR